MNTPPYPETLAIDGTHLSASPPWPIMRRLLGLRVSFFIIKLKTEHYISSATKLSSPRLFLDNKIKYVNVL